MLDNLVKLIWNITYSSIKYMDSFNLASLTELIKDSVEIFNRFVSELELHPDLFNNNKTNLVIISKENLDLLLMSYTYLNIEAHFENKRKAFMVGMDSNVKTKQKSNLKKLNIKNIEDKPITKDISKNFSINNNLNLDFLKNIKIVDYGSINFISYKKFIVFHKLIEHFLNKLNKKIENLDIVKTKNLKRYHYSLDTNDENIEEFNFFKDNYDGIKILDKNILCYLDPSFSHKTIVNEALTEQIVFINQPYECLNFSDSLSGKVKIRRELCKRLKIKFIEYDFYEFLNYTNMMESDFNLTKENFDEYSQKIEEYINVKSEVFSK